MYYTRWRKYIHWLECHKFAILIKSKFGLLCCVQSCLTLWDPVDSSLLGSSVHEIPRQEYWSGLPFLFPGDLPGVKPESPEWQVDSLPLCHKLSFIYKATGCPPQKNFFEHSLWTEYFLNRNKSVIKLHSLTSKIFYWGIVYLRCCVNFCCIA